MRGDMQPYPAKEQGKEQGRYGKVEVQELYISEPSILHGWIYHR